MEAIRVREGKARIMEERCIDCGECIRICPNHAKVAVTDPLERIRSYRYSIALPAPALYGQFKRRVSPEQVLSALISLGFDRVFEVALAAEVVAYGIGRYLREHPSPRPLISSACPAVVRLIQIRFHSLVDHIIPIDSPMEVAAKLGKDEAVATIPGLKREDVGAFFITPCPAKMTSVKQPVGIPASEVDGVISAAAIYGELLKRIADGQRQDGPKLSPGGSATPGECACCVFPAKEGLRQVGAVVGLDGRTLTQGYVPVRAGAAGIGWGRSGGESASIGVEAVLAVDGIHSVIDVLEEVEKGALGDVDFIEAQACVGGCIGGCLMPQSPFISRVRLKALAERRLGAGSWYAEEELARLYESGYMNLTVPVVPRPVMALDEDVARALEKLGLLEKTLKELPGLDCGACGSPSCRALAEDIVRGLAVETDCTFKLRERVQSLAEEMAELARRVPPAMGGAGERPAETGANGDDR